MPVSTQLKAMYRTVQIASDPRCPIGMSRPGLIVS